MRKVETARLAALHSYGVLDTPPEEGFDRLTQLAAELFDAPIALVSLLDDDRQWFKSRYGLEATQTPRAWAFCDHAIAMGPDAIFVVEDARDDLRFADNPLVVGEPRIRFYAGAALTTSAGENLGTLCVIDLKPRPTPSANDLQRLKTMAQMVVGELETRRTAQAASEHQRLLSLAEAMSGVGRWRLDARSNLVTWSDEVYNIHGVARSAFDPNLDDNIEFYHREDQDIVRSLVARALSHREGFEFRLRLKRADGALRNVMCKADCEIDGRGETLAIFGVFQDVTEQVVALAAAERALHEAQEKSRQAAVAEELAGLGRWRVDFPGEVLTWSDQMYAIYGLDRTRRIDARAVLAMTHPDDLKMTQDRLDKDLAGDATGERPTIRIVRPDGATRWVIGHATVERDADGRVSALVGTLQDITQKTEAARRIQENEARYRLLTEHSLDLVIKMSPDAILEYVSPSITPLLGYDHEDMIGRSAEDLIYTADLESWRVNFAIAASGNEVIRADYRLRHKDGSAVWVDARRRLLRSSETDEIVGLTDVIRDVTDRKLTETALALSEAKLRQLADCANDVVMQVDPHYVIQYVSQSIRRYGYNPEEIIGLSGASFIHPDDVSHVLERGAAIAAGAFIDPTLDRAYRVRMADGGYVWMEGNSSVVRDDDGATLAIVSYMRDVTERKAASAALAESEARYRQLADSCTDIVLTMDRNNVIQYVSPSTRRYGYEPEDLVGVSGFSLVHPDDLSKSRAIINELFETGQVDQSGDRSYRIRKADGSYVWMEGNPAIICAADGSAQSVISQLRDISDHQAANAALAESEMRHRLIAESATDIISRTGIDGRVKYFSPSVATITGHTVEEITSASMIPLLHPDDLGPTLLAYRDLIDGDAQSKPLSYRIRHKEGHWV